MKTTQLATFKTKNVYGNVLIYPENETAKQLIKLTRKTTADKNDIAIIQSLGYDVLIDSFPLVASLDVISAN